MVVVGPGGELLGDSDSVLSVLPIVIEIY
jgi:hypothetical protein